MVAKRLRRQAGSGSGDRGGPPRVAGVLGEILEACNLPLALDPDRVILREIRDKPSHAVADLQSEMRRGRAGEGTDVVDAHGALAAHSVGSLVLTHGVQGFFCSVSAPA